jgi:cell wall-associated NlpC family hydrolase
MDRTLFVSGALAHLRRDPSHVSELVSQLVLGEKARVLEEADGWLRIAGPDGYPGWAHARSLVELSGLAGAPALIWSRRGGLLREGPAPDSAPLCDLVLGARVAEAAEGAESSRRSEAGPQLEVLMPDGSRSWADAGGWVAEARRAERFARSGTAVVETALALRGVPYLWGGTSSKAFDCSGFVQRVFALHDVPLPRDAYQQAEVGVEVDPGAGGGGLRAGDLVFFAEGGGRVTHVGLALGERGRFVHSSTGRAGVGADGLDPADRLYAPKLAETLVSTRRVL